VCIFNLKQKGENVVFNRLDITNATIIVCGSKGWIYQWSVYRIYLGKKVWWMVWRIWRGAIPQGDLIKFLWKQSVGNFLKAKKGGKNNVRFDPIFVQFAIYLRLRQIRTRINILQVCLIFRQIEHYITMTHWMGNQRTVYFMKRCGKWKMNLTSV